MDIEASKAQWSRSTLGFCNHSNTVCIHAIYSLYGDDTRAHDVLHSQLILEAFFFDTATHSMRCNAYLL